MRKLLSIALNPGASTVMYEHVGGVLCNATRVPQGRALLLEGDLQGFRAVVGMLGSRSEPLRTGAAATVKNMVMGAKEDEWFDQLIHAHDVLEKILVRSARSASSHKLVAQEGALFCHPSAESEASGAAVAVAG
jgi:hypothetical protein